MNEYIYKEIKIGQVEAFQKVITKEMEDMFRQTTGDENPLHKDDAFALELGQGRYKSHVAFGMLTASLLSTLAGMYLPGKYSLIHSIDALSFKKPVFLGDCLTVEGTVGDKLDGLNLLLLNVKIRNQENKVVLTATMKVLVQK